MIYLYSGTPGSGKSLHTARTILHWMGWKTPVIANFPIKTDFVKNPELFTYMPNEMLRDSPQPLIDFALNYWKEHGGRVREGKLLLVLDEAQQLFGVRSWNAKGRDAWIKFFCEHRKLGFDVILVAQFQKMLDNQLRALIEYETIHRKLSNYGLFGLVVSFILGFGKPMFVSVQVWAPMREKVSSEFFFARKKFYQIYDTFQTFDAISTSPASDAGEPVSVPASTAAEPGRTEKQRKVGSKAKSGKIFFPPSYWKVSSKKLEKNEKEGGESPPDMLT